MRIIQNPKFIIQNYSGELCGFFFAHFAVKNPKFKFKLKINNE